MGAEIEFEFCIPVKVRDTRSGEVTAYQGLVFVVKVEDRENASTEELEDEAANILTDAIESCVNSFISDKQKKRDLK
jgi:hypothetical protein